mmetsp:Transcript_600/g.1434  ORF Transcript_600/g.1434 Transcript_600/m.1434 type:complete len:554 (-) Transcript_600:48-1709(-)
MSGILGSFVSGFGIGAAAAASITAYLFTREGGPFFDGHSDARGARRNNASGRVQLGSYASVDSKEPKGPNDDISVDENRPEYNRRSSAPNETIGELQLPEIPPSGILLGIDIGGTLSKVVMCFSPGMDKKQACKLKEFVYKSNTYGKTGRRDQSADFEVDGLRVIFLKYETARTSNAIELMKSEDLIGPGAAIGCTGGGAFKYNESFQEKLKCGWVKVDEMGSLVAGIAFLIQRVPKSIFKFSQCAEDDTPSKIYLKVGDSATFQYPRLLVNCGTGVSLIFMEGPHKFRRVGGSATGGGTFLGLIKIISGITDFQEALDLARKGNSKKVDLLVGDIYGGHYCQLGLSADTIAAYFAKFARWHEPEIKRARAQLFQENGPDSTEVTTNAKDHKESTGFADTLPENTDITKADIIAALLKLITYSIGSTAWLYARIYKPRNVVFTGNFLRGNDMARHQITFMVRKRSKGDTEALFMEREGYFGALGALLGAEPTKCRSDFNSTKTTPAVTPANAKEGKTRNGQNNNSGDHQQKTGETKFSFDKAQLSERSTSAPW